MTIGPPRLILVLCFAVSIIFVGIGHMLNLWEEPFLKILMIGLLYALIASAILIALTKISGQRIPGKPLQIGDNSMPAIIVGALSPIIIVFGLTRIRVWSEPFLTILGTGVIIGIIYAVTALVFLRLLAKKS